MKAIVLTGNVSLDCIYCHVFFFMTMALFHAMDHHLNVLKVRKIVIVLCSLNSGKGGRFSGGFDISVMQKVHQTGKLCWYNCARCKI